MPPRRRTFYLADATLLSNPKVIRLRHRHPDEWLAVLGGFHVLIGVATLNGSPRLSKDEIDDVLGGDGTLHELLRNIGFLTRTGIDRSTYEEWCPKARPRYPSDDKPRGGSGGNDADSGGVGPDSGGVGQNSAESGGVPTSVTSSSSGASTDAPSSPPSRADAGENDDGLKPKTEEERRRALADLSERFRLHFISEIDYKRQRRELQDVELSA